ncbi:hypothetical protein SAMN05421890_4075 [Ensifer adhaerens]|nr:hypothetical protein SAMN05421890_4075 [Ensifer adhaerens]
MQVSNNYASAPVAEKKGRELSKTQQAVQAQLAHNKQQAKVDADKLAKVSGKQVANDDATAKAGAAAATAASATAATAAAGATTSTKAAANAKSVETTQSTQATQKKPAHKETVFEKQHAYNQSMSKLHASMLAKVSTPDSSKTQAAAQPSAAAAQAATAKYMENSGQNTGTTTTYFRA